MKKWVLILVIAFFLTACKPTQPPTGTDQQEDVVPEHFFWDDMKTIEENLLPEAQSILAEMGSAPYYLLDFELDPELDSVKGTVNLHYTNTSEDRLPYLVFQLFPVVYGGSVYLGEITVDQQSVFTELHEEGTQLHVVLDEPLLPGESVLVYIPFESTIPREMGGNYGLYGYFDEILVLDGFYPMMAIYDGGEWRSHITSPNGDIKFQEMSLYAVTAKLPLDLQVISTGKVTAEKKEAKNQILSISAGPVREFYFAASEHFITRERAVDNITLRSTGLAGNEDAVAYALNVSENAVISYSSRFGPYPYTELDIISTPMQALGMEYPGVSTIATGLYDLSGNFQGTSNQVILDSVIAHEIGHQWFFNLVGNDQVEEPWLDEALTQYIVRLYYEDTYGESAAQSYADSWNVRWSRVNFAETPIGLASYEYDSQSYGSIVYGRGPYFIEALENEMGEEAFARALKTYFETYAWDVATAAGFRQSMETVCTCDLTSLFEGWVKP
jgi:hypothetical protein